MLLLQQIYFCLICRINIPAGHHVHLSRLTSEAAACGACIVVPPVRVASGLHQQLLAEVSPIRATVTRKSQIISPLTSWR